MGDLLGNLIFIAVAILAWIVKEAVERKEAKDAGERRPGRAAPPAGEADAGTGEVDIVYGRRPLPEAITAPPPEAGAVPTLAAPRPEALAPGGLSGFKARALGSRLGAASAAPARTATARGPVPGAWARLGIGAHVPRRDAVRAGVLWSEVLALPRAVTGPHRSPAVKRLQRRA